MMKLIAKWIVELFTVLVVVCVCIALFGCGSTRPPIEDPDIMLSSTTSTTMPDAGIEVHWFGGPDEAEETRALASVADAFNILGGRYQLSSEYRQADGDSGTAFGGYCNSCRCHAYNQRRGPFSHHTAYCLWRETSARWAVRRHECAHTLFESNIPDEDRYPVGAGHMISVRWDNAWMNVPKTLDERWPLLHFLRIGPSGEPKGFICGFGDEYNGEWDK